MSKILKIGFVGFYILCAIEFFELQVGGQSALSYLRLSVVLITAVIAVPYFFIKSKGFVLPVQIMCVSIVLSVAMANIAWGQSLLWCVIGTTPFLVWFLFFYLKHMRFSVASIENIMLGFGILYILLYFFQFTHPGTAYFGEGGWDDSRGVIRIIFPGRGLFYFLIFMGLCKFSEKNSNKYFWGSLLFLGLVITVLQVTRQFMVGVVLIYLLHFLQNVKFYQKALVLVFFLFMASFIYQSDHPIVNSMKKTQEQTVEAGTDNIRIEAARFFLTKFSKTNINRVLGNGVPYYPSSYGGFSERLNLEKEYWLSDVGLVSIYVMFGVLGVLAYLLIWIKSFTVKLPKAYRYLKYYLWFSLMTCLTSDTIYASGDLIALVLVVYSYHTVKENERYLDHLLRQARSNTGSADVVKLYASRV